MYHVFWVFGLSSDGGKGVTRMASRVITCLDGIPTLAEDIIVLVVPALHMVGQYESSISSRYHAGCLRRWPKH